MHKQKNKKNKYYLAGIFLCIVVVASIGITKVHSRDTNIVLKINGHNISVDVADTSQKQERGLGGRESICAQCGMIFLFDTLEQHKFWMKDMRFDIDIVWLDGDSVVHISKNVSHENQFLIITVPQPTNRVLELPAGQSDIFGLKVGQQIRYPHKLY